MATEDEKAASSQPPSRPPAHPVVPLSLPLPPHEEWDSTLKTSMEGLDLSGGFPEPPLPPPITGMNALDRLLRLKTEKATSNPADFPELYQEMFRVIFATEENSFIRTWASDAFVVMFRLFREHGLSSVQDIPLAKLQKDGSVGTEEFAKVDLQQLSNPALSPNDSWLDPLRVWHYWFLAKLINTVNENKRYFHYRMQRRVLEDRLQLCAQPGEIEKYPPTDSMKETMKTFCTWNIPFIDVKSKEVSRIFHTFYDATIEQACISYQVDLFSNMCAECSTIHPIIYTASLMTQPSSIPTRIHLCEAKDCGNIGSHHVIPPGTTYFGNGSPMVVCNDHADPELGQLRLLPIPNIDLFMEHPASAARYVLAVILHNRQLRSCIAWWKLGEATLTLMKSLAFLIKNTAAHMDVMQQRQPWSIGGTQRIPVAGYVHPSDDPELERQTKRVRQEEEGGGGGKDDGDYGNEDGSEQQFVARASIDEDLNFSQLGLIDSSLFDGLSDDDDDDGAYNMHQQHDSSSPLYSYFAV